MAASLDTTFQERWQPLGCHINQKHMVNPDPNTGISGIKWQPGGGFVEGEFAITLRGNLRVGAIDVAVKGPDVALGTLEILSASRNRRASLALPPWRGRSWCVPAGI